MCAFSGGGSRVLAPLGLATGLLEHAVDLVLVVEVEGLGSGVGGDALSVEEEAEGREVDALAGGVGVEDLLHLGGLLYLEEGFLAGLREKGGERREEGRGGGIKKGEELERERKRERGKEGKRERERELDERGWKEGKKERRKEGHTQIERRTEQRKKEQRKKGEGRSRVERGKRASTGFLFLNRTLK